MFRIVFIALGLSIALLPAQQPTPSPASTRAISAFSVRPPDENSPFFLDAQLARQTVTQKLPATDEVSEYPKNRGSEDSAWAQFSGFFTGMFSSVNIGPIRTAPVTSSLAVEPAVFPLQDRRELSVTYSIRNNTKEMMRFEYPTTQRIDILTYDAQGKPIDKWSEDRTFEPQEGIVVLNPKERIEYQEKIPTREMKSGQEYRVDASATTDPNFLTQQVVTPQ